MFVKEKLKIPFNPKDILYNGIKNDDILFGISVEKMEIVDVRIAIIYIGIAYELASFVLFANVEAIRINADDKIPVITRISTICT